MSIAKITSTIGEDKIIHFLMCYAITLTVAHYISWYYAFGIAVTIGVLKEIYDLISKQGTPDWKDLLADLLGAGVATLICIL